MMHDITLTSAGERCLIEMADDLSLFPTLEAYWHDPAPFEAEKVVGQARLNAVFAPHEARVRAQMEARWTAEEAV